MHIRSISLISKSTLMGNQDMFCSCCMITRDCRHFRSSKIRLYMINMTLDHRMGMSCKAWYSFCNKCFFLHEEHTLACTQGMLLRSISSKSKDIFGRMWFYLLKSVQTSSALETLLDLRCFTRDAVQRTLNTCPIHSDWVTKGTSCTLCWIVANVAVLWTFETSLLLFWLDSCVLEVPNNASLALGIKLLSTSFTVWVTFEAFLLTLIKIKTFITLFTIL